MPSTQPLNTSLCLKGRGAETRTEKGEGRKAQLRAAWRRRRGGSLAAVLKALPGCPQVGRLEETRRVSEFVLSCQSCVFRCQFSAPARESTWSFQASHLASVAEASDPFPPRAAPVPQ